MKEITMLRWAEFDIGNLLGTIKRSVNINGKIMYESYIVKRGREITRELIFGNVLGRNERHFDKEAENVSNIEYTDNLCCAT